MTKKIQVTEIVQKHEDCCVTVRLQDGSTKTLAPFDSSDYLRYLEVGLRKHSVVYLSVYLKNGKELYANTLPVIGSHRRIAA